MHTTVSDGTDSPEEILKKVKRAGIDVFSITDHDDIAAFSAIRPVLTKDDPYFLPGVEFSTQDDYGKYHILGYGYDPDHPAICAEASKLHAMRMDKMHVRVGFVRDAFGFTFSEEDLAELMSRRNPGKPHLGNLLVKYGYAKTKEEAILKYINKGSVPNSHIDPAEAIRVILAAGGVPVLAHAIFGSGEEYIVGSELEFRLEHLMSYGLMGVEAYYSGFTEAMSEGLVYLAEKHDLYITAGSDYHGRIKKVRLGDTGLPSLAEASPNLVRFLEEVVPEY